MMPPIEELLPMRGIMSGLLLALPFWLVVAAIVVL